MTLDELVRQCVVRILVPNDWGTGFFVGEGAILTCAHVVNAVEVGDTVKFVWQDQEHDATIAQKIPATQADVALLRFVPFSSNLPCVCLGETANVRQQVYTYGFPNDFQAGGFPATGQLDGQGQDIDGAEILAFSPMRVKPGRSGSPLLNLDTGYVCGIIKLTQGQQGNFGGGAVPTSEILKALPEVAQLQAAFHQKSAVWTDLLPPASGALGRKFTSAALATSPPELENWQGRTTELSEVATWLTDPQIHLIGLQGLGGMGKSALGAYLFQAVQGKTVGAAELNLPPLIGSFTRQLWVDVGQAPDFTVVAEYVIGSLGGDRQDLSPDQLINGMMQALTQTRCLLVVDNLETLLDFQRQWQQEAYGQFFSLWRQQGTTSTVLVTTRTKPKLFEGVAAWYPLGGLPQADGLALMQGLGVQGDPKDLGEFVYWAAGHPLTLKLAAAFVREYCNGQWQQAKDLGWADPEQLVSDAEGPHRDQQQAKLDWILQQHWQQLNPAQRQLLAQISIYRQPIAPQLVAYLQTPPPPEPEPRQPTPATLRDSVKLLQDLANRSLLQPTAAGQYQLQPLVQRYAQAQSEDITLAHHQAIDWYRATATPPPWQELTDVTAYLEQVHHYSTLGRYAAAFGILDQIQTFLALRGYSSILANLYAPLVAHWQPANPQEQSDYAWAWILLGNAELVLSKFRDAVSAYQRALEQVKAIGETYGTSAALRASEGAALGNLGLAYLKQSQYGAAAEYSQQSLTIAREIGDRASEGVALGNLGLAHLNQGQYGEATEYSQQQLTIAREIGDRNGAAKALFKLGLALEQLDQRQDALEAIGQARSLFQAMGLETEVADCDQAIQRLSEQ